MNDYYGNPVQILQDITKKSLMEYSSDIGGICNVRKFEFGAVC